MGILSAIKGFGIAAKVFAVTNAPGLLVAGAIVGVGVTVWSAFKAGRKAERIIQQETQKKGDELTTKEKVKATWSVWVPVVIEGTLTCASMGLSYYIHAHRLAQMTQMANLLMASNKELQSRLDKLAEKHPEIAKEINESVLQDKVNRATVNARSRHGGNDLIYDPNTGLMWWDDYSHIQTCIADSKESYWCSGLLDQKELYDRFDIDPSSLPNGLPRQIYALAWVADECPSTNKVPRINTRVMFKCDAAGRKIDGSMVYVLEYFCPSLSPTWSHDELHRPYGIDLPAWEDNIDCEDDYEAIARQMRARPAM